MGPEEDEINLGTDGTSADADDDGFNEGFAGTAPTETPGQGNEKPEGETGALPAAPEYVQFTKEEAEQIRARLAAVDELKTAQERGLSTAFGKLGGIERTLKALDPTKKVEIEQAEIDALLADPDFAPFGRALQKVRDLQVIHAGGPVDEEAIGKIVDQRVEARTTAIRDEIRQDLEKRALRRVHPDWETYQASDEFAAWARAQGDEYIGKLMTASQTWDSDFIADAMTKAKAAAKKPQPTPAPPPSDPASARRARMAAAATPRGTGGAPAAGTTDDDAFDEGFNDP